MSGTDSMDAADRGGTAAEAARLFVRAEGGEPGAAADLASWLDERPEHERALERIDLAMALGKQLAGNPVSALHFEALRAANAAPRRHALWYGLAWGGALAAAATLAAVLLVPGAAPPRSGSAPAALRAAERVAVDAPGNAAAVLPTGVVVDASAVAVLPFAAAGDTTLARGLQRDVVAALRGVPGLYVIAGDAVQPYAATELSAADIGGQLGARGIVEAAVELADGRVRVSAQLRDAATGATLWHTDVARPVDELSAIRYEIAENVAAAMFDSDLRELAARTGRASAPVSASKPLLQ
jgi:TolB-like protein